jgi:hypothetical protein
VNLNKGENYIELKFKQFGVMAPHMVLTRELSSWLLSRPSRLPPRAMSTLIVSEHLRWVGPYTFPGRMGLKSVLRSAQILEKVPGILVERQKDIMMKSNYIIFFFL